MTLIGSARAALGRGGVTVLHGGGAASDECILTIVVGTREGVGHAEVEAVRHAAVQRDSKPVIDAGGCAVEFVDRAELRDRPSERVNAGWKGASHGPRHLPVGEVRNVVVSTEKISGLVVDGIG